MQIDPAAHSPADNYKVLTNLVVPRPIAWVTSIGASGVVNLAPYSFFNAVCGNPLYVVVSVGKLAGGSLKDTGANIAASGDFVVNLVTEALLGAMNISAIDFPPDESEIEAAGLHTAASVHVRSPRLAEASVSLECRLHQQVELGDNVLVIGQVVMFHVADGLIDERLRVHGFAPIGRLGSPSLYCRTTDRFDWPRIGHAQWQALGTEARAEARAAPADTQAAPPR